MAVVKEKEKSKEQSENAIVRLFRDTRSELRKVVWPSREETFRLTVVVILVSVIIGLILFVSDSIFFFLYAQLSSLVRGS